MSVPGAKNHPALQPGGLPPLCVIFLVLLRHGVTDLLLPFPKPGIQMILPENLPCNSQHGMPSRAANVDLHNKDRRHDPCGATGLRKTTNKRRNPDQGGGRYLRIFGWDGTLIRK